MCLNTEYVEEHFKYLTLSGFAFDTRDYVVAHKSFIGGNRCALKFVQALHNRFTLFYGVDTMATGRCCTIHFDLVVLKQNDPRIFLFSFLQKTWVTFSYIIKIHYIHMYRKCLRHNTVRGAEENSGQSRTIVTYSLQAIGVTLYLHFYY